MTFESTIESKINWQGFATQNSMPFRKFFDFVCLFDCFFFLGKTKFILHSTSYNPLSDLQIYASVQSSFSCLAKTLIGPPKSWTFKKKKTGKTIIIVWLEIYFIDFKISNQSKKAIVQSTLVRWSNLTQLILYIMWLLTFGCVQYIWLKWRVNHFMANHKRKMRPRQNEEENDTQKKKETHSLTHTLYRFLSVLRRFRIPA